MVRHRAALTVAFASLTIAGCPEADVEPGATIARTCGLDVWVKPLSPAASVELIGSWNGFARPGRFLERGREDGWRVAHVDLPAGPHRYALVEDGVFHADPLVPTTAWENDREVTWVTVDDCSSPLLRIEGVDREPNGAAVARLRFVPAASGARRSLDRNSVVVTTKSGEIVSPARVELDESRTLVRITLEPQSPGKHVFFFAARDEAGRASTPIRASVWSGPTFERDATIVYQVMIDRFENGDGPIPAPTEPGARAGGTLTGVRHAIERGDIEALGANTLWLSPVYKNAEGFFPGGPGRRFSSYHGYWPVDTRAVEPAIGGENELDLLVAAAHGRGLRILVDVVPNHVHADHPYWSRRTSDAGFNNTDGTCLCGQGNCPWATSIERCWFAPYLPDLDTRDEAVLGRTVDDVLFWLDRYDVDGLRIDAVPMMPRSTTRRIAALARSRFEHPGHRLYLVGETFTSERGFDALRYNLGPMGLDGQFHFPLMWALRKAIALESEPLPVIEEALREGETSFAGSGAVMATMIGNHDVTRFASESDGTAGGDGFDPAPTPSDPTVYAKQKLALGILFALPGAPVVYYGDEVALPGRVDPDSRRVMPAESSLRDEARDVRSFTRAVGKLRAACPILRQGTYVPLVAERETWAFARPRTGDDAGVGSAVVVIARRPPNAAANVALSIPRAAAAPGRYVDALDPGLPPVIIDDSGLTSVPLSPFSLRILLPEGDPCVSAR